MGKSHPRKGLRKDALALIVREYDLSMKKPHQFTQFLFVLSRFDISLVFVFNHTVVEMLSEGSDAGRCPTKVSAVFKLLLIRFGSKEDFFS